MYPVVTGNRLCFSERDRSEFHSSHLGYCSVACGTAGSTSF